MKKVVKSNPSKAPKLAPTRAKGKVMAEPSPDEPSAADLAAAEIEAKEVLSSPAAEPSGLGIWAQSPEKQERLRELIKLAREQGYLTYDDLHEALPETVTQVAQVEAVLVF
ncbi:MAG: RNA polymerase sigma factor region1.1 domain-containing protein, partial [Verrucomicrobia bacterium]|nr:RNA polymerase sigma factor region1.1 domain-containing protein [Verrucomicrobiota bacterium]